MNWVSIGSGNGLAPKRRQAITWTNADLLSIGPLGTNFSENWVEILTFSFKKIRLKMSSAKWRPFCPGGDEFNVNYFENWPAVAVSNRKVVIIMLEDHRLIIVRSNVDGAFHKRVAVSWMEVMRPCACRHDANCVVQCCQGSGSRAVVVMAQWPRLLASRDMDGQAVSGTTTATAWNSCRALYSNTPLNRVTYRWNGTSFAKQKSNQILIKYGITGINSEAV